METLSVSKTLRDELGKDLTNGHCYDSAKLNKGGLGSDKKDVFYEETCGVEFCFHHLPVMPSWASNLSSLGPSCRVVKINEMTYCVVRV